MVAKVSRWNVWATVMVVIIVAWSTIFFRDPRLAGLGFWTYWASESSFVLWQMRGLTLGQATLVATAIGDLSAFNLWFFVFTPIQDLQRFPILKRWVTNHQPSADRIKQGEGQCGLLRYLFVLGIMGLAGILPGVILGRILNLNKRLALVFALGASTARNLLWGKILTFLPWRVRVFACIAAFFFTVMLALLRRVNATPSVRSVDEA